MDVHERALGDLRAQISGMILEEKARSTEISELIRIYCDVIKNKLSYIEEELTELTKKTTFQDPFRSKE